MVYITDGLMEEKCSDILEALFFITIGFLLSCRDIIRRILDKDK